MFLLYLFKQACECHNNYMLSLKVVFPLRLHARPPSTYLNPFYHFNFCPRYATKHKHMKTHKWKYAICCADTRMNVHRCCASCSVICSCSFHMYHCTLHVTAWRNQSRKWPSLILTFKNSYITPVNVQINKHKARIFGDVTIVFVPTHDILLLRVLRSSGAITC